MNSWNYRIMRKKLRREGGSRYSIHEVFYGESGEARTWTSQPVGPEIYLFGKEDRPEKARTELWSILSKQMGSVALPILDYTAARRSPRK